MSDQYERLMMVVNRYGLESYRIGRDRGDGKLEQPAAKNAAFTAVEREARILEASAKMRGMVEMVDAHGCKERADGYECPYLLADQDVLAALIQQREEG